MVELAAVIAVACTVVLAVVVLALFYLAKYARVVRQSEVILVERLGRFDRVLKPGFHLLTPIDRTRKIHWSYLAVKFGAQRPSVVKTTTDRIDMRVAVIDFARQSVITRDTVSIVIDGLLFYQITDPVLAAYKIQNLPDALELLTQSTLRNLMAHITLDETFSSREQINSALKHALHEDCERWGVTISRVEIQNIIPPREISRAMETMIVEERARASKVLRADGDKQSKIIVSSGSATKCRLDAEGDKQSEILRARGAAQSREVVAESEARAVEALRGELGGSNVKATNYFTAIQSLNALRALGAGAKPDVTLVPAAALRMADQILASE